MLVLESRDAMQINSSCSSIHFVLSSIQMHAQTHFNLNKRIVFLRELSASLYLCILALECVIPVVRAFGARGPVQWPDSACFNLISLFNFLIGWFPNSLLHWDRCCFYLLYGCLLIRGQEAASLSVQETKAPSQHITSRLTVINVLGFPLLCLLYAQACVCVYVCAWPLMCMAGSISWTLI